VSDIFDETEENLRTDKWVAIIKAALPIVGIALGAALVLALAVWGWQSWQASVAAKSSEAYQDALETAGKGDLPGAKSKLQAVAKTGNAAYKSMALMALGGLALNENNAAEAVKDFDQAAGVAPSPMFKDMAVLKSVMVTLDTAKYDDVKARLTPLAKDGRPYASMAKEALAIARLQSGDVKGARSDLNVLTLTLGTPEGVKDRASLLIQAIDSGAFPAAKAAQALPEAKAPAMPQQMPGAAQPAQ